VQGIFPRESNSFMDSVVQSADSRLAQRQRLLRDGQIILHRGWSLLDCRIVNASASGAGLTLNGASPLPQEFDLLHIREQTLVPCEVSWRRGNRLGVRFTGPVRNRRLAGSQSAKLGRL
jgi:hypothetical protein